MKKRAPAKRAKAKRAPRRVAKAPVVVKRTPKRRPKAPAAVAAPVMKPTPPRTGINAPNADNWKNRRKRADAKEAASKETILARQALSPPPAPLPSTDAEWDALIRLLPKFDPYALAGECQFVPEAAVDAIEFIEAHVRHHEGELGGQLLRLEPWQRSFIANLFGWLRPDGLTRRFSEALLYVAKKNGKSLLCEGIALYLFHGDGVFGAKVYCAAAKRDQARIIWNGCLWQIQNDEALDALCERYQYEIKKADTGFLKPISADASKEDGMNPSGFVLDELHRQPDSRLLNMARLSMKTRRNSLLVCLTTSDADGESVCNDEWRRFSDVRDNPGDPTKPGYFSHMLPAIFEAGPEDDWTTEAAWRAANPNLGVTIPLEEVEIECRAAKENPGLEADFRRYRLNQRVKTTSRMFDMIAWDKCGGPPIDPASLVGRSCVVAIDLASTTDLVAQVALFPSVPATSSSLFLPAVALAWFWCPEAAADDRLAVDKRNVGIYRAWKSRGFLTLTSGDQIDEDRVCTEMIANVSGFRVREWAFDPWNASRYTQRLMALGVPVTAVRQGGWTMNEPLKALSVAIGRGEFRHGGNPVLRWMANNAEREDTKAGWILGKAKGSAKIDGISALATAWARAMVLPGDKPRVDPATMATFVPFRFGRS